MVDVAGMEARAVSLSAPAEGRQGTGSRHISISMHPFKVSTYPHLCTHRTRKEVGGCRSAGRRVTCPSATGPGRDTDPKGTSGLCVGGSAGQSAQHGSQHCLACVRRSVLGGQQSCLNGKASGSPGHKPLGRSQRDAIPSGRGSRGASPLSRPEKGERPFNHETDVQFDVPSSHHRCAPETRVRAIP